VLTALAVEPIDIEGRCAVGAWRRHAEPGESSCVPRQHKLDRKA
jgi:hypothetical protein